MNSSVARSPRRIEAVGGRSTIHLSGAVGVGGVGAEACLTRSTTRVGGSTVVEAKLKLESWLRRDRVRSTNGIRLLSPVFCLLEAGARAFKRRMKSSYVLQDSVISAIKGN